MFNKNRFCAFILSHGRANKCSTYRTLKKSGYTGRIFIVIDDQDKTRPEYMRRFGKELIVFNKQKYIEATDSGDNFNNYSSPLYARNAVWDIAKDIGVDYFVVFDDDYNEFRFNFDADLVPDFSVSISDLDSMVSAIMTFVLSSGIHCAAISQRGDFFGGHKATQIKTLHASRKIMNSFFCVTERPFQFMAKLNDDTTTYIVHGCRGLVLMTIFSVALGQEDTQHNAGGLTDLYLSYGTYVKSFYTVMFAPSCTEIRPLTSRHPRLHHRINWDAAVPKILRESVRK